MRHLPILLFISIGCGGGTAQRPSSDLPQVSADRLQEHIRYLASDRLAGRMRHHATRMRGSRKPYARSTARFTTTTVKTPTRIAP